MLRSWTRHLTFTMPLSTQVYKWVAANLKLVVTVGLVNATEATVSMHKFNHTGRKHERNKAIVGVMIE